LFDREDPFNPVNRRIDIVVLTKKAQRTIESEQNDDASDTPPAAAPAADTPPEPLPAGQLRERLNIFEEGVLQMGEPRQ
jgi:chemotaxis protein MotB